MKTQLKAGCILALVTFSMIALSTHKVNAQCVAPSRTSENTLLNLSVNRQIEVTGSFLFVKNTEDACINMDDMDESVALINTDTTTRSVNKQTEGIIIAEVLSLTGAA